MILKLFILLFVCALVSSNNEIRNLQPTLFWNSFVDFSQIPRCSTKEKRVREEYVKRFAQQYGFKYMEDKYGNCVIKVPATPGKEGKPTIVLQSHLDMVCEKNRGSNHDFEKDPLKLRFSPEGKDWVIATETTLGADDGAGMAASFALVLDKSVSHGPLELLFTVEEETGLVGAQNLKNENNFIVGTHLVNVDSGTDGQLTIGCAGGQRFESIFRKQMMTKPSGFETFKIHLKGLQGGHSGKDIDAGRANSIKLMGRLLFVMLKNIDFTIVSLAAGTSANALPREFETVIAMPASQQDAVQTIIQKFVKDALLEYQTNDPGIEVLFEGVSSNSQTYTKQFSEKIINLIQVAPHGVVAMSPDIPNLVETSVNFAAVTEEGSHLTLLFSIRSSIDTAKFNVANTLKAITFLGQGNYKVLSDYPGWKPDFNSPILQVAKAAYRKLYGKDPVIKAIHAGLEPGIIGSIFPQLKDNMLSMGPDIIGNHSPTEKMRVSSVVTTYNWLKEIVESYAR